LLLVFRAAPSVGSFATPFCTKMSAKLHEAASALLADGAAAVATLFFFFFLFWLSLNGFFQHYNVSRRRVVVLQFSVVSVENFARRTLRLRLCASVRGRNARNFVRDFVSYRQM
jgi:hypothetical protein